MNAEGVAGEHCPGMRWGPARHAALAGGTSAGVHASMAICEGHAFWSHVLEDCACSDPASQETLPGGQQ